MSPIQTKTYCFAALLILVSTTLFSQQVADTSYHPPIVEPAYPAGEGPVVMIDEGHFNFHTKDGRYLTFAELLERDGYRMEAHTGKFTPQSLEPCEIMVISNALHESNAQRWFQPNPSAFTTDELIALKTWVWQGGNLFLIADHMPFGGAASDLAAVFGFHFTNGFAIDTTVNGPSVFNLENGGLKENPITAGRSEAESVQSVATFTGQAFKLPEDAAPILEFDNRFINLLPDTAWAFREDTPQHAIDGWSQGAIKKLGLGRIVVFGEAAMFSAQLAGPQQYRAGMNSPIASENYQLLLNLVHWLDGLID